MESKRGGNFLKKEAVPFPCLVSASWWCKGAKCFWGQIRQTSADRWAPLAFWKFALTKTQSQKMKKGVWERKKGEEEYLWVVVVVAPDGLHQHVITHFQTFGIHFSEIVNTKTPSIERGCEDDISLFRLKEGVSGNVPSQKWNLCDTRKYWSASELWYSTSSSKENEKFVNGWALCLFVCLYVMCERERVIKYHLPLFPLLFHLKKKIQKRGKRKESWERGDLQTLREIPFCEKSPQLQMWHTLRWSEEKNEKRERKWTFLFCFSALTCSNTCFTCSYASEGIKRKNINFGKEKKRERKKERKRKTVNKRERERERRPRGVYFFWRKRRSILLRTKHISNRPSHAWRRTEKREIKRRRREKGKEK